MTESGPHADDSAWQPGLTCWFCSTPLRLDEVLGVGILRSRSEAEGGPYRLFSCPSCHRHNRCERTGRGRWYSSPTFRPNILEYLFGRLFAADPQDFLQAVSWYRENEERRRYFFERDGDQRYSAVGILSRLWSGTGETVKPAAGAEQASVGDQGAGRHRRTREAWEGRRDQPQAEDTAWDQASHHGGPPPVVTPWEILGVRKDAEEQEIRRAFHRLAVQYHPDKVHHLGQEFQTIAHQKFTALQRAYEDLLHRKRR